MDQWEFYDADGTQVLEERAQFKARMVMVPGGIPTTPDAGNAGQWLYQEVQWLDAPAVTWRCKSLDELKAGIAYYVANYRWPTKH
jgi:hypothetical protein